MSSRCCWARRRRASESASTGCGCPARPTMPPGNGRTRRGGSGTATFLIRRDSGPRSRRSRSYRPFADRVEDLSTRLTADRASVVAWVGAQSALCVYFHANRPTAEKALATLTQSGVASSVTAVTAQVDRSEVPVYFDYEGLWSHLSGLNGPATYPNGLGGRAMPTEGDPPTASPHQVWAAKELVGRPFDAQARGRGGHLIGPFGLPFSQQKLLRSGWVTYRVVLEPSVLPPYQGRSADQVALISGRLRSGAPAGGPLRRPDAGVPGLPIPLRDERGARPPGGPRTGSRGRGGRTGLGGGDGTPAGHGDPPAFPRGHRGPAGGGRPAPRRR